MSKCPWRRYWTLNRSRCAVSTLHFGLCHQWRAPRWAGDSSEEHPAFTQRQLGLDPAKKNKKPQPPKKGWWSYYSQWMDGWMDRWRVSSVLSRRHSGSSSSHWTRVLSTFYSNKSADSCCTDRILDLWNPFIVGHIAAVALLYYYSLLL